jgi:hypothetical protein
MSIRSWTVLAGCLLTLGQLSCAAVGLTPLRESMPAARAGLAPEYRLFYDALQDDGQWILIEPLGYVFRPRGNVVGWRPYQNGYWAPSDVYGWVWISAEPFGWATYHYGDWIYDRFQGWVWIPGLEWGPAWVAWEQTNDYVGWAPLSSSGHTAPVPGGTYLYVPTDQLAATDLRSRTQTAAEVGPTLGAPERIENLTEREGVTFNRGPSISFIEKRTGRTLQRVKVEDVLPAGRPGSGPSRPAGVAEGSSAPANQAERATLLENMRRAAEESARQARALAERKSAPPPTVRVLRPSLEPEPEDLPGTKTRVPIGRAAPADTSMR